MSKKLTSVQFIENANLIHNGEYDYSNVEYINSKEKVEIICKKHGSFLKTPKLHIQGQGCPKCSNISKYSKMRYSTNDLLIKLNGVHNNVFEYKLDYYENLKQKIDIKCNTHGWFTQRIDSHLRGTGCPKCGIEGKTRCINEWIKIFNSIHGSLYTYDKIHPNKTIDIICGRHGLFTQSLYNHKNGSGCPKCGIEKSKNAKINTQSEVLLKFGNTHPNNIFDYSYVNYKNSKDKVYIKCNICNHIFLQAPYSHIQGKGCPKCGNNGEPSVLENEIFKFLKHFCSDIQQSNRKILDGKEIDIYIPNLKLGIEFNGLYWHSDVYKDNNYHVEKLNLSESKGIKLIQIFEDEWVNKKEIVKSRLLNLLNLNVNKIYARKCIIKEVSSKECSEFLEKNHIQGKLGGKVYLGLYFEKELVSVMTFGSLRKNLGNNRIIEDNYELLRFCNKLNTNVIGGAGKLLKYFERNYNPKKIISYADRRWSQGDLYYKLGFKLSHISQPNYFYTKGIFRENRFKYRKDILVSKYGCDPKMTEKMFTSNILKLNRIYDCGNLVFVKNKKDS